ncbi:MAG TPA: GNAT family N-acetyltransferase [Chthoniobacterales bacterium]|nr:GNAT family N-acetyltransferase [Chthoniobacterales bacterium]
MRIEYLADHLEALPVLARWQHEEWGGLRPGDTLEARTARLGAQVNRDRIPLTVVALDEATVLGSASLISEDMDTRPELTPWLASVFVDPAKRRRGIAGQLVRRIVAEAARLGVPLLYLYTVHSEKLYARLGWTFQERTTYRESEVVIMTCEPAKMPP